MCKHGTTVPQFIGRKTEDIDECIYDIVRGLNDYGHRTVASCCGHGHRPGNIALADGRELIIAPDFATARQIDALFPLDIHGEPVATDYDLMLDAIRVQLALGKRGQTLEEFVASPTPPTP